MDTVVDDMLEMFIEISDLDRIRVEQNLKQRLGEKSRGVIFLLNAMSFNNKLCKFVSIAHRDYGGHRLSCIRVDNIAFG